LRNLHEKTGFDATSGRSMSGFGYTHDGGVDTLARFVSQKAFRVKSDREVADLTAFLLSFAGKSGTLEPADREIFFNQDPYDVHAGLGYQVRVGEVPLIPYFAVRRMMRIVDESHGFLELVAQVSGGQPEDAYLRTQGEIFIASRGERTLSLNRLLQERRESEKDLVFTLVPGGSGRRLSVDRDGDGLRYEDEVRDLAPDVPGVQNPFDPFQADTTGDQGQTLPDGIPDGQNDFDGDSVSNAMELLAGSDPIEGFAEKTSGFRLAIEPAGEEGAWQLRWEVTDRRKRYQVESSFDLKDWKARSEVLAPVEERPTLETVVRGMNGNEPTFFRVRQVP
ncbi:MAG: hypothetical protein AAF514_24290, partial [Verrucomicrobiota bacterium]